MNTDEVENILIEVEKKTEKKETNVRKKETKETKEKKEKKEKKEIEVFGVDDGFESNVSDTDISTGFHHRHELSIPTSKDKKENASDKDIVINVGTGLHYRYELSMPSSSDEENDEVHFVLENYDQNYHIANFRSPG